MRILMIAASLPPLPSGGAELQALKLGKELERKGFSVSFVTPAKGMVRGRTELDGMPVFRLYSVASALFNYFSRQKKKQKALAVKIEYDDKHELTNQITGKVGLPTVVYYNIFFFHCLFFLWRKRNSFDIIHAHTMEWSAIVAVRLGKVLKKPVLIKDSTMNGFASLSRFPYGRHWQQRIIRGAHFVAMTGVIKENLRMEGVPEEKITLIPNGINAIKNEITSRRGNGSPKVLFVGNLYQQPAKGVDILLKAWCTVTKKFPAALLQLIGDGDLPAYQEFAKKLGIDRSVRFEGKRSDTDIYYRDASVFVLPSRREGMSNALMEAMMYGLPCVATDISGSRDLIEPGHSGILVPAVNIEALADAICYLLANPEEALQMGKSARKAILHKAEMGVVADKYISLYKAILLH